MSGACPRQRDGRPHVALATAANATCGAPTASARSGSGNDVMNQYSLIDGATSNACLSTQTSTLFVPADHLCTFTSVTSLSELLSLSYFLFGMPH